MSFFERWFGGTAQAPTRIDPKSAHQLVSQGAVLVDVRTPAEFSGGSLPGARNVPLDRIQGGQHGLKPDGTYVLFCRSGARSAQACQRLREEGFDKVHDLGTGQVPWPA
jgi:phage shock protein E